MESKWLHLTKKWRAWCGRFWNPLSFHRSFSVLNWLSLVKILILLVSVDRWTDGHLEYRSHKGRGCIESLVIWAMSQKCPMCPMCPPPLAPWHPLAPFFQSISWKGVSGNTLKFGCQAVPRVPLGATLLTILSTLYFIFSKTIKI